MGLVLLDQPLLLEQRIENGVDGIRGAERLLQPRSATAGRDDGELAWTDLRDALLVEDERDAGSEEGLADDETAAPTYLDDQPIRQLHAQEAAERQAGARCPEQQADAQQDQGVGPERDRLHARAAVEPRDDRRQSDLLAQEEQDDGEQGADKAAEQPLEHERPADEPVRRPDELHHLDLASPGEDREADR